MLLAKYNIAFFLRLMYNNIINYKGSIYGTEQTQKYIRLDKNIQTL